MDSYDVYIVAPVAKLSCDDKCSLSDNILKLHEAVHRISETYKAKVDIYSLAKVKINSVPESCKKIDEATCTIIIIPSENVHDFMILIGHAIARNKKIYILLMDNKTHDSKAGIIANGYENVYVECVNPMLNDFNRLEQFVLSAVGERSACNA